MVNCLYLVDNSPSPLQEQPSSDPRVKYLFTGSNLGYGKAHNIALRKSVSDGVDYHLVMNSDVTFSPSILAEMTNYMHAHSEVGLMMPKVYYPHGETQYVCKLLPAPIDVFGRRFLPTSWIRRRNDRYQLTGSGYNRIMNVPNLSGCFMLLRTKAVQEVGYFDERFFMYTEDMDLTRRIHQHYQTLFYPACSIKHEHERASYFFNRLFFVHIESMCKYFFKWGWFFDSERREVNRKVLEEYILQK